MPKYIYNGTEFTEQEVAKAAAAKRMTLEDYISHFEIEVVNDTEEPVTETVQEDFQTDPVKETASAGSKNQQAVDTESPSVGGSSEQPNPSKRKRPFPRTDERQQAVRDNTATRGGGIDPFRSIDTYNKDTAEENTINLAPQLGSSVWASGNTAERDDLELKLSEATGNSGEIGDKGYYSEYGMGGEYTNVPSTDEDTWDRGNLYGLRPGNVESRKPESYVFSFSGEIPEGVALKFINIPQARELRTQEVTRQAQQNNKERLKLDETGLTNWTVNQGLKFLGAEETQIYNLQEQLKQAKTEDEKKSIQAKLDVYTENYGGQLYDPTTGGLVNYKKASEAAQEIEQLASEKAELTDLDVLESELNNSYHTLVGLSADIYDITNKGRDIFNPNMTSFEGAINVVSAIMGSEKDLEDDKKHLAEAADGELPEKLNYLPGDHPLSTAFNESLKDYLVLNRAVQLNRDPATVRKEDLLGEFTSGLSNALGAGSLKTSTSVGETADTMYSILTDRAGYEPKDPNIFKNNLYTRVSRSVAYGVPEFGLFIAELAVSKKVLGVERKFKLLNKVIKGIKNTPARAAATVASKAIEEASTFVFNDAMFSGITKRESQVDYYNTSQFGFSLGAGNGISSAILSKIPISKYFSPIMVKMMDNSKGFTKLTNTINGSKGLNAWSRGIGGAATGSMVFQFAQAATDLEGYKDKSWEDIGTEFLTEYYKMRIISGGQTAFTRNGMFQGFTNDILKMRGQSLQFNAIANKWGIKPSRANEDALFEEISNINKQKENEVAQKLSKGEITEAEAQEQYETLSKENSILEFQVALNTTKASIEKAIEDGFIPKESDIFSLIGKIKRGEKLNEKDNYTLTQVGYPVLADRLGVDQNQKSIDALFRLQDNAVQIEQILDGEFGVEFKTQKGGEDRTMVYDYLTKAYDKQAELHTLKSKPNKTDSDNLKIKELEKELEQYDQGGERYELLQEKLNAITDKRYTEDVEQARSLVAEGLEGELIEAKNPETFQQLYEEAFPEKAGQDKRDTNGFWDPNTKKFYVNTQRVKNIRNVTTATHEVTHYILKDSLKENGKVTEEGVEIINDILSQLNPSQRKTVQDRIDSSYRFQRDADGNVVSERSKEDYYEEYLTVLSENMRNGKIVFNEKIGSQLLDFIPIFRRSFPDLEMNSGTAKDIFNMLKSYSKGDISEAVAFEKANRSAEENLRQEAMESVDMERALRDLEDKKITEQEYNKIINDILDGKTQPATTTDTSVKGKTNEQLVETYNNEATSEKDKGEIVNRLIEDNYGAIFKKGLGYDPKIGDIKPKSMRTAVEDELLGTDGGRGILKTYKEKSEDGSEGSLFSTYLINVFRTRRQGVYKRAGLDQDRYETTSIDDLNYIETQSITTPEEISRETVKEGRLVMPTRFMPTDLAKEATDAIDKEISREDFNFDKLTFATAPAIVSKQIAKMFGLPENKVLNKQDNLKYTTRFEVLSGKGKAYEKPMTYAQFEALKIKDPEAKLGSRIESEADGVRRSLKNLFNQGLFNIFPPENVAPVLGKEWKGAEEYEFVKGTSLKLPRNFQKAFYEGTGKRSKGKTSQTEILVKKKLTPKEINKILDVEIPEGSKKLEIESILDNNAQLLKGIVSVFETLTTNSLVRKQLGIRSEEVNALSAGKAEAMFSAEAGQVFQETLQKLLGWEKGTSKFPKTALKTVINGMTAIYNKAAKTGGPGTEQYTAFINKLENEKGEDVAKIVDFYFQNRLWEFGIIAGQKNKNLGIKFEKFVQNILKPINEIRGVKVTVKGGFDNKGDVIIRFPNGMELNIELKSKSTDQNSSITVNKTNGKISNDAVASHEAVITMQQKVLDKAWQDKLEEYHAAAFRYAEELGGEAFLNKNGNLTYSKNVGDMLVLNGDQAKLTIEVATDASLIRALYEAKNTDIIHYADKGTYLIKSDDAFGTGARLLEGEVSFVGRLVQNSANEQGLRTASFRAFPIITSELKKSNFDITKRDHAEKLIKSQLEAMESASEISKNLNENLFKVNNNFKPNEFVSAQKAKVLGTEVDAKMKIKYLLGKLSPEANDFRGLLYETLLPGKEGDKQKAIYDELFTKPFNRAYNRIDADNVYIGDSYKKIKKATRLKDKSLNEKIGDTYFRRQDAARVYIWQKQGLEIEGITQKEKEFLLDYARNNEDIRVFADAVSKINKGFGFAEPGENWISGNIQGDIVKSIQTINRVKYLSQWQTNVNNLFSVPNMNKMEAMFGSRWRKAMDNSLYRQKTGKNRYYSVDSQVGRFADQLSGSVLNTLNFNNKSAILQLLSSTNFINWTDNNPMQAGKAFANQPQFWKDFGRLMQSDFLKERRSGLKMDLNDADIADLASGGGFKGFTAKMLKIGMTPTVIADNIAIAGGGATFYRNRIKKYEREGLTTEQAEAKAFEDFRETAETSQQSNRPDKISMQQAGPLGRITLAYTNTPQQYMREMQKALSDIKNNRGDYKTNISKIAYYGFMQNMIFTTLQQGFTSALFEDDDDEVEELMSQEDFQEYIDRLDPTERFDALKERKLKIKEAEELRKENSKKTKGSLNTINGMLDTGLKGLGLYGQVISTLKNAGFKAYLESQRDNPDYSGKVPVALLGISPGLSTKFGQLQKGINSFQFNEEEIKARGLGDWKNPAYEGAANILASFTNIPLNRYYTKATNVSNAFNEELSKTQRVLSAAGWSEYSLNIKRKDYQSFTDEELVNLAKWKQDQLDRLDPISRGLYFKWAKERDERMKKENK